MATYIDDENNLRGPAYPRYASGPQPQPPRAVGNSFDGAGLLRTMFATPEYPFAPTQAPDGTPQGQPTPTAAAPLGVPASRPETPTALVRAVDNNVANSAAIANPASVLPQSYTPAGAVTTLAGGVDTLGQINRDIAHAQDMQKLRNPNDPTPGMAVIGPADYANRNAAFNDQADLRNALGRTRYDRRGNAIADPAVQVIADRIRGRERLAELSLQNEGRMAESRLRDATDRRGQDLTAQTAARAQDVTLRGQDITARTAANTARVEQMNKDRQFQLDVAKFGQDQAKTNYEQRRGAEEAYDKELATTFRTKDDKGNDVPDTGKIAAFKAAANTTIPALIDAYKRSGTPAHLKMANDLETKGFAALDKSDKEELQQLFERRERMRASTGLMRGSANLRESDNLLDYRQRQGAEGIERRAFGGDRLRTVGGGDVSVNDLRYTEPANSILPDWFKTRTNDYARNLRLQ